MWFKKKVKAKAEDKLKFPDGLWVKCEPCGEILYRKELEKNLWICPKCNFHFRISCRNYISLLFDNAEIDEKDANLESLGHMTARRAGSLAHAAGVGELLLTHIWPEYDRKISLEECSASFNGHFRLAERNLVVPL